MMAMCATAVNSGCSEQQVVMTGGLPGKGLSALLEDRPRASDNVAGVGRGSPAWPRTNNLAMQLGFCQDSAGESTDLKMVPQVAKFQHQVAGHGFKFGQKVIKDDLYGKN